MVEAVRVLSVLPGLTLDATWQVGTLRGLGFHVGSATFWLSNHGWLLHLFQLLHHGCESTRALSAEGVR